MLLSLMTTMTFAVATPPTYEEIKYAAIHHCHRRVWHDVDVQIVEDLIDIESHFFKTHPIPVELRGMLLAAACNESGYNPQARGDWTKRKGQRIPLAKGIVQLHSWWAQKYGVNRYDHFQSSRAWMEHIVHQRNKIDRKGWCKGHSNIKKWVVAWVQTTRGRSNKKNNYRCSQSPSHYKHLKRWHNAIDEERNSESTHIEPGC